jgi:predicted enzyme related to lactoylglutathione lyase
MTWTMGDHPHISSIPERGRSRASTSPPAWDRLTGVSMEVLFASVPVSDLKGSTPWYEQLFGRAPDIVPNENEVMWCITGTGWLYVIQDAERAGRTTVTISVSDLDRFVGDLADRGIRTGPIEAVGEAGRKAIVVDADGNVIAWIEVATVS